MVSQQFGTNGCDTNKSSSPDPQIAVFGESTKLFSTIIGFMSPDSIMFPKVTIL